jgi:5,10-methylenetetrahydromethanopterin reductase
MRISRFVTPDGSLDDYVESVVACERRGFYRAWVPQIVSWDALIVLALAATRTATLRLGSGVLPVFSTHPLTMAAAAMTTQAAAHGRLSLGIGTSHKFIVEHAWGLSFRYPTQYMREYLAALLPAMRGEFVTMEGGYVTAQSWLPLKVPGVEPPEVVLAALGPRMLDIAGRQAAGTITWLTGIRTLREHVIPTIQAAADQSDRPAPQVIVGMPVCVTTDRTAALALADEELGFYGGIPSYRAMLDREGAATPSDVAIIGTPEQVREHLGNFAAVGATEFSAMIFGTPDDGQSTEELLAQYAAG